jgi:hypothetical protein
MFYPYYCVAYLWLQVLCGMDQYNSFRLFQICIGLLVGNSLFPLLPPSSGEALHPVPGSASRHGQRTVLGSL